MSVKNHSTSLHNKKEIVFLDSDYYKTDNEYIFEAKNFMWYGGDDSF